MDLRLNLLGMLPCFASLEFYLSRVDNSTSMFYVKVLPSLRSYVPFHSIPAHAFGLKQHDNQRLKLPKTNGV